MSKAALLQTALNRAVDPQPEPASTEAGQPAKTPTPPSREGKVHIGVWCSTDYKKSLRIIQSGEDRSIQSLLIEALNDLFRKHNVPSYGDE